MTGGERVPLLGDRLEILADQSRISAQQGCNDLADALAREWLALAARSRMNGHVERAAAFVRSRR